VVTFAFVIRDGSRSRGTPAFGWSSVRQPDGAYALRVVPGGPAATLLRTGDVVVAMNGDRRIGRWSPSAGRQFIEGDEEYSLTVRRDGQESTVRLRPLVTDDAGKRRFLLSIWFGATVWCVVATLIALLRPDLPAARAAYAAGITMGLYFFGEVLFGIVLTPPVPHGWYVLQRSVSFFAPLHLALGLDFYLRFPLQTRPPRILRWLRVVVYVGCGFVALFGGVPDVGMIWLGKDPYISSRALLAPLDPWFGRIVGPMQVLVGIGVLSALTYSYRHVEGADDRRRLRWIVWGTLAGVVPFAVVSTLQGLAQVWPAVRTMIIGWNANANLATTVIPISFGYAIIKHQVFDIAVVIRRGMQYLLAKQALQALVFLPVAVLVYGVIAHRDESIGQLLVSNSLYIYFLAAAVVSLRFRMPLMRWVDRRFFRESYDRERILVKLVEDVGQLDSASSVSKLVSHEIEAAFHPRCLFIWYREPDRPTLALSYSSGGYIHTAELGPAAPLVQLAEREQRIIDVPGSASLDALPSADRAWLGETGVRLIVPMSGGDRHLVGLLMLGEKKSEEPYASGDRALLQAIAGQIALARENARLKDRADDDRRIRHDVLSKLETGQINLLKECPRCGACYDAPAATCRDDGAELTLTLPIERTIEGKYRLERLIGRGGMGAVYEASDLRLARSVAVKVLLGRAFGDRDALRRFEREAQASARLTHPNVVAVHDFGPVGADGAFIAMELVRGRTLRAELRRHGACPPAVAADWFEQVFAGVAAAHAQGIVHRDLKPENAIIASGPDGRDRVKVLDFGLAKLVAAGSEESRGLTQAGAVIGTPGYMAPEQMTGGAIDERTDIFALGVMVAEAVTGTRPFDGRTTNEILAAVGPQPIQLKGDGPHWRELERVLQQAVARSPGDRYRHINDLVGSVLPALRAFPPMASNSEEPTRMA
jgi:GAF domain-containing protein